MRKRNNWLIAAGFITMICTSCAHIPKGARAVSGFQPDRYLGKWYEIARFDYLFEKNLNNVTATYTNNDHCSIKVLNSGYNYKKEAWKSATGKAKFRHDRSTGALKVSFFGPFYAAYNVIAIDQDYQYALVAGKNLKYLWILSRTPSMPAGIKEQYLAKAAAIGYDTTALIWVEHNK